MNIVGLGKCFECLKFEPYSFAVHSKLNFFLRVSKLRCHAYFNVCTCTLVQSKCVDNSVAVFKKVEAVLLAASVSSFLSTPVMLNPSRNSNRNKTSTRNNPVLKAFYWQ